MRNPTPYPAPTAAYHDRKEARNPRLNLHAAVIAKIKKDFQTAQKVIGRLSLCSSSAVWHDEKIFIKVGGFSSVRQSFADFLKLYRESSLQI